VNPTLQTVALVACGAALALCGAVVGYHAGVHQGEANTMQEVVHTCLQDVPPPFCVQMLDMVAENDWYGNETQGAKE